MPSVDPPPKASGRKSLLTRFRLAFKGDLGAEGSTHGGVGGGTTGAAKSITGTLAGEATAREATAGEARLVEVREARRRFIGVMLCGEVREARRIRFIGVMLCGMAFHRTS